MIKIFHLSVSASLLFLVMASCGSSDVTSENCIPPNNIESPSSIPEIEATRTAMITFRSSLSEDQLGRASTCLSDPRLTRWSNLPVPILSRDGILYSELTSPQIQSFQSVMRLFLSAEGYQKVEEITTLAEGFLENIDSDLWGVDQYSVDMFGDPNTEGSWGFQLDGHHCALNFMVHGNEVSIVPAFLGGEPIKGRFNGRDFDILVDERELALTVYRGMNEQELSAAVSDGSSATMVLAPPSEGSDRFGGDYDYSQFTNGLKYSEMSDLTKANIISLMREFVYNLNPVFAVQWWNDVMENVDETYFVWIDEVNNPSATTPFYYRIYNPYLWAEYNTEPPVGDGIEDWNHAHTVIRIPNNPMTRNGGDYNVFASLINGGGPRTLLEHYQLADHHSHNVVSLDYRLKGVKHKHLHKRRHHLH